MNLTCAELCAGGGGMALGLQWAGWEHDTLIDHNETCCETLRANGHANVICDTVQNMVHRIPPGLDMICGGPPCQPFSAAGHRKGADDERDAFADSVSLALSMRVPLILYENVPGLMFAKHEPYRKHIGRMCADSGYAVRWLRFNCQHWGVPQRRNRVAFMAVRGWYARRMWPPLPPKVPHPPLAKVLYDSGMPYSMIPKQLLVSHTIQASSGGSHYLATHDGKTASYSAHMKHKMDADRDAVVPCVMGGSGHGSLHSGPDQRGQWVRLGIDPDVVTPTIVGGTYVTQTRKNSGTGSLDSGTKSKAAWNKLGVNPNHQTKKPKPDPDGLIRLSVANVAAIQGFPHSYVFTGTKREQYSMIGNALPPPAAQRLGAYAITILEMARA